MSSQRSPSYESYGTNDDYTWLLNVIIERISSPFDISLEGHSANDSRSASLAHQADVSRSVESGTDAEKENEIKENENELNGQGGYTPRKIVLAPLPTKPKQI
jgi:hypothetical protein